MPNRGSLSAIVRMVSIYGPLAPDIFADALYRRADIDVDVDLYRFH
jgi:hypothetical protein